jgi:DnaJ-class molecular chaperone
MLYPKEKFKQITEAYEVLSDSNKRREYDRLIYGHRDNLQFSNQHAYEYYKNKRKSTKDVKVNEHMNQAG